MTVPGGAAGFLRYDGTIMIVVDVEQGSSEWFEARCGVVTASNFGRILARGGGRTRRSYLYQLAEEIRTGRRQDVYENQYMARGRKLEPRARQAYETATGVDVRQVGMVYLDARKRIAASPDGLIGENGGLEIKCPLPKNHLQYWQGGGAPAKYVPQIQGNLWVTGRAWWDFISYAPEESGERKILIRRIGRDEAYIRALQTAVEAFVYDLDCILERENPRESAFAG